MKSVLILQHIDIEGPGTLEDFLKKNHIPYLIASLFQSASSGLKEPQDYSAIISLGGPMNVYEEERYHFLRWEDGFLKKALKKGVPLLGVCLGAQLIAKAAGAQVKKAPTKEIGWYEISLTEEGSKDPLFQGLPRQLIVFQWHGDTFDVPKEGKWLAQSPLCPHQAFRYGDSAYALQFHLEVTQAMIAQWIEAYKGELESLKGTVDPEEMLWESAACAQAYNEQAERFYRNFFHLIRETSAKG